jgi:hypothetical protein
MLKCTDSASSAVYRFVVESQFENVSQLPSHQLRGVFFYRFKSDHKYIRAKIPVSDFNVQSQPKICVYTCSFTIKPAIP